MAGPGKTLQMWQYNASLPISAINYVVSSNVDLHVLSAWHQAHEHAEHKPHCQRARAFSLAKLAAAYCLTPAVPQASNVGR